MIIFHRKLKISCFCLRNSLVNLSYTNRKVFIWILCFDNKLSIAIRGRCSSHTEFRARINTRHAYLSLSYLILIHGYTHTVITFYEEDRGWLSRYVISNFLCFQSKPYYMLLLVSIYPQISWSSGKTIFHTFNNINISQNQSDVMASFWIQET